MTEYGHPEDLLIPIESDTKEPWGPFGGWPIDPDEPMVYTRAEARELDHEWFAIVQTYENDCLVLDIDPDDLPPDLSLEDVSDDLNDILVQGLDSTRIVKTQNDGFHVYVRITGFGEDDVRTDFKTIDDGIHLKGEVAKGYALDPEFCPGYDVVCDQPIRYVISDDIATSRLVQGYSGRADREFGEHDRQYDSDGDFLGLNMYDFLDPSENPPGERSPSPFHATESTTGTNLLVNESGSTARCWRCQETGNAAQYLGVIYGYWDCGDWYNVEPEIWSEIRERAVDDGYLDPTPFAAPGLRHALDHAGQRRDGQLIDTIRRGFQFNFKRAVRQRRNGIVAAPTGIGKTTISVKNANDEPEFLGTSKHDNYDEAVEMAERSGVSYAVLPSFFEDTSLRVAEIWPTVKSLYERGVKPKILNSIFEEYLDDNDPYVAATEADWDHVDLLIGHASWAFVPSVVKDRVVIFDDIDAFEIFSETFTIEDVREEIKEFLDYIGSSGFSSVEDVIGSGEYRALESAVLRTQVPTSADLLDTLERRGNASISRLDIVEDTDRCTMDVLDKLRVMCLQGTMTTFDDDDYLSTGTRGGRFDPPRGGDTHWWLARAPYLDDAECVIFTQAFPDFNIVEQFLSDAGVASDGELVDAPYAQWYQAHNYHVVQTSHFMNSNAGADQSVERAKALVREVEPDAYIDHLKSMRKLDGELPEGLRTGHFGAIAGLNYLGDCHIGVVGGTQHFGDEYVGMRAQYCGESPELVEHAGKPAEWTTSVARAIYDRMLEQPVHEAITRLGRWDQEPTIVFVDTRCIPEWFDVVDATDSVQRVTESDADIWDVIGDGEEWTVRNIANETGRSRNTGYGFVKKYEDMLEVRSDAGDYNAMTIQADDERVINGLRITLKPEHYTFTSRVGTDPWWAREPPDQSADGTQETGGELIQTTLPPPD